MFISFIRPRILPGFNRGFSSSDETDKLLDSSNTEGADAGLHLKLTKKLAGLSSTPCSVVVVFDSSVLGTLSMPYIAANHAGSLALANFISFCSVKLLLNFATHPDFYKCPDFYFRPDNPLIIHSCGFSNYKHVCHFYAWPLSSKEQCILTCTNAWLKGVLQLLLSSSMPSVAFWTYTNLSLHFYKYISLLGTPYPRASQVHCNV